MASRARAVVLIDRKLALRDGSIVEARVLRVPQPVVGSTHLFKYALFYGRPGERLVLYDNERLKGDHRHLGPEQEPYLFTTVERLMRDFLADVREVRRRQPKTPADKDQG
jgi:hypothetical protein